ncbi:MAG: formate dehydrogenase accessory sulfurtransferase FdhD [Vicinamibacterales bacterium]
MMRPTSARSQATGVWKFGKGEVEDLVATEEPLEIRLEGRALAVTLRTPGDDEELAAGFVVTEGLVTRPADIERITVVDDVAPAARGNVVDVRLTPAAGRARSSLVSKLTHRPSFITSACGVCGRGTIDAISRRAKPLPEGRSISAGRIIALPDRLRAAQAVFAETGGLHAAGLFDFAGNLLVAREDVGRHNAVDKVVGYGALLGQLPFSDTALLVSGRAGFEIILKAWIAGIPIVASVSAPSHLAVQLAEEAGMTLIGFLRGRSFTVYHGRDRIESD